MKRAAAQRDETQYQTVYAAKEGAVAAPTAGLHFTERLFRALDQKGVKRSFLTLHVGAGTFRPVTVAHTEEHVMHTEYGEVSEATAEIVNRTKAEGKKIIAVGTTALRTLEYASDEKGKLHSFRGNIDLFITPGYRFKIVDRLLTNFHLPRSTLFMLVSAFSGLERMQQAYHHAIAADYRFYSYGDACLLDRIEEEHCFSHPL
jgi:S-adenosylmethionine:tRNA ribosyltransferase-isomerase